MKQTFFEWKAFSQEYRNLIFPVDAMGNIFLMDVANETLWLSRKCAELLSDTEEFLTEISQHEFEKHLSDVGKFAFRQAIQRAVRGEAESAGCHASVEGKAGSLSSVIYLYRISDGQTLLGHISVDYEPMREYEQHMGKIIQELQYTQKISELTVEGAVDFAYQYDVVNDTCTFSSRILDVLPLETPMFSNAVNTVLSFIVPEDRGKFLETLTPFLSGEADRQIVEFRVKTKTGDTMWLSARGKGIHDEQGNPLILAGSWQDITEQKEYEKNVERMLYKDELTGLGNQRCFNRDMKKYLSKKNAEGSILYMNIRRFKMLNELFGYKFGDKVLVDFADMLKLFFPGANGIYRFSGDEYLVHLAECERDQILKKLIPFQNVLKKNRQIAGHSVFINTYIAVVIYPEHGKSVETLLNKAHQCLYRMTRAEQESIRFFSGKVGDSATQQFLIENEIRRDIELDFQHFRLVYQPIVSLEQGGVKWMGAEALLRYSNPNLPNLEQMEMIRTLEYSGLILPVGRWVLKQAIMECSKWNRGGEANYVHVNIAAQQISDVGLAQYILDCCKEVGLMKSCLTVELTETSMLGNFEVAKSFCEELLKEGIGVALDDFGTGYSSFNYLRNLPISELKIDRSYVRDLATNEYNQTFISFMHQLAKQMNVLVCVEGVETEEELNLLRTMDISIAQGFYFERPMESDVICREFLTRSSK